MFGHEAEDPSIVWSYRSAPEIRQLAASSGSIFVLPVGSIEQHGIHLPVATDSMLATATSLGAGSRTAEETPVLVGPTVWTGYSPHHRSLGGTMTTPFEELLAYVRSIVSSAVDNGFDAVLIVNGHGGNRPLVGALTSELGRNDIDREYLGLTYFDLGTESIVEHRDSDPGGMAHGGEFETSLMLHLYPELVSAEAAASYLDEPYDLGDRDLVDSGPLSVYRPFEAYSESGAVGDPDAATAEKGAEWYGAIVDELASLIDAVSRRARSATHTEDIP